MITRDFGVIWSRLGYWLDAVKFWNNDVLISDTQLKIVRLDDQAPKIACAGFGQTNLVVGTESTFNYLIYAVDPCVFDHIDHIELCVDGVPIGYEIEPKESQNTENWYLFDISWPMTPDTAFTGMVEYRAVDSFGNCGPGWPQFSAQ